MTSTFVRQLAPCARNGLSVRPPPVTTGNSSPPIPCAIPIRDALDRKLTHETEAAFLETLIALEDGEQGRQLRASLIKADRERKRLCHAMLLMVSLFVLSLAGLSYCALLLPQGVFNPSRFVAMSLSLLGLASLIAQLEFFGYLLWHRIAVNRLYKECRRRVLLLVESRHSASLSPSPSADLRPEPVFSFASTPSSSRENTCEPQTQL